MNKVQYLQHAVQEDLVLADKSRKSKIIPSPIFFGSARKNQQNNQCPVQRRGSQKWYLSG